MPRGMAGEFVERRARLDQRGERFVPHIVAIGVGGTVEFPNSDPTFHNVFSLSSAATFDLGRYPMGRSKSAIFAKPGLVKVYCHIHSQMSASILVLDHPYFARATPRTMLIDEMEALWTPIAERDDWSALAAALDEIETMRQAYQLDTKSGMRSGT